MPRPPIREWNGQLFRRQLNAALDYLDDGGGSGGGGGALIGLQVTVSDTEPSSPAEFDLWIESDTPGPSGQVISIGTTAPGSPNVGDLWLDTN
jgi:hypothetical protein